MKEEKPAEGTRVRINAAGKERLGTSRARDFTIVGTVVGWNEKQKRPIIRWDGETPYEAFPLALLDEVTA